MPKPSAKGSRPGSRPARTRKNVFLDQRKLNQLAEARFRAEMLAGFDRWLALGPKVKYVFDDPDRLDFDGFKRRRR